MLHDPIKDVEEVGALLECPRLPNELEECYRTRIAYLMHVRLERPISGKMLLRMALWGQVAREMAGIQ